MAEGAKSRVVLQFEIDDSGVVKGLEGVKKQVRSVADEWRDVGRGLSDVGGSLTKWVTAPLVGVGGLAVKTAMDFESSFAGIVKTVDDATDSLGRLTPVGKQLQQGMRQLAKTIPINVNELNRIGEAAGQLGIRSQNIVAFTETVAKMGVTTLLSSEEAAEGMARLANITQMPQTEFERLGSTIVALGNNFATTEPEILEFGLRIAGAGASAGMAEHQILAIGTAVASVGIQAEAGGTAVQRVILDMLKATVEGGTQLEVFARTAGMSADEFRRAFEEDAARAFERFVVGLGREGQNAIAVLDELGLADARLIRTFLSLANASDLLTEALDLSKEAWEQNTALSREAQLRFQTTEARVGLLMNRVRDLGITFGNALLPALTAVLKGLTAAMPYVEGLANAFAAAPQPIQFTVIGLAAVAAGIGPVLWGFGQLITSAATVASAFGSKGIATAALTGKLGALGSTLSVLATRAIPAVGAAMAGWNIGKWLRDIGAMGDASETASQQIERLGLRALTLGERVEFLAARFQTMFTGNFVSDEDLMLGILSRRQAALEDLGEAVDETSQALLRQQQYLQASIQGLVTAVEQMRQQGASSADVLKEWGADAAHAAATAKRLGLDTASIPPVVRELAKAYLEQESAARRAARSSEAKEQADRLAKEAAEAATRAAEAQRQALRSLGITTSQDVVAAISTYNEALSLAATQGATTLRVATGEVILKLLELRQQAIASGLAVDMIDAEIVALRASVRELAGEYPNLHSQLISVNDAMRVMAQQTGLVTAAQVAAQTEAALLGDAYKTLGIESQAALVQAADEARRAYDRLVASGRATQYDLERAWEAVLEAERRTRREGVSIWRAYVDQVIGLARGISKAFTDQILGINSTLHEEKKRAAESAKEEFERTQREALDAQARTEQMAREEHARTTARAREEMERRLEYAAQEYQWRLAAAGDNAEAIREVEEWYEAERIRIRAEGNTAVTDADKALQDTLKTSAAETAQKIAESDAEMRKAIEDASHPWKDRMLEIWRAFKDGVRDILSQILSDFVNNFLAGMLSGLQGWAQQAGKIIGQALGIGGAATAISGGATAAGAGSGASAAGAAGLGSVAAFAAGAAAPFVIGALVNPDGVYTSPEMSAQWEVDALMEGAAYLGISLEEAIQRGLADGLSWEAKQLLGLNEGGIVDAGPGGLAMLHGTELVAPLPAGFDLRDLAEPSRPTVGHVYLDGRELIRSGVVWLPDEADRMGAFVR